MKGRDWRNLKILNIGNLYLYVIRLLQYKR
jgi:hypothetical protein